MLGNFCCVVLFKSPTNQQIDRIRSVFYIKANKNEMRYIYKLKYLEVKDTRHNAWIEAYAARHLCLAHLGAGSKKIG